MRLSIIGTHPLFDHGQLRGTAERLTKPRLFERVCAIAIKRPSTLVNGL
jgi:hypothetical protein